MKIKRLSDGIVTNAIADRFIDPTNEHVYYNLTHGNKGHGTWKWFSGLKVSDFNVNDISITLDGDNYNLVPVYKKGKLLKDNKNNICYNVVIDNDPYHKNDILLLWNIPSRGYKDIEYDIDGVVEVIGVGVSGKSRGESTVTSPAPVLEIAGDCVLMWRGKDVRGNAISQTIEYSYHESKWVIGGILKAVGDA